MRKFQSDAQYLLEHYKQGGQGFANMLYLRIIKQNNLKNWEAIALKNEFLRLLKQEALTA